METVTLDHVRRAQSHILGLVHRTPIVGTATLSRMTGTNLLLKVESLQKTGSFKVRGATFAARDLSPEDQRRGVIAVTAGNHGAALAYAARRAGIPVLIVMPDSASRAKIAAVEGYGAEVVLAEHTRLLERMEQLQRERGSVFIHPFGSTWMIAGAGTVGVEIVEDAPEGIDAVLVGVGGGGLIAGVALAVKSLARGVRVIGVEPETSNVVARSLAAGAPQTLDHPSTIADGLNAPFASELSLGMIRRLVDDMVTVTDAEIAHAMRLIMERTKFVVEPAGAAAVAALLAGKIPGLQGKRVLSILSGGNVDIRRIGDLLAAAP